MTDQPVPARRLRLPRIDRVWLVAAALPLLVALVDPAAAWPVVQDAARALASTAPFILFAVLAIGYLKATGAETLIAGAFKGREARMIVVAAFAGGLSPFCSCEVIPFIAALLAAGAPLSGVMAFWLASPLMDPAMFAITAGALGTPFAVAKLAAAIGIALLGGLATMAFSRRLLGTDILRAAPQRSCCGGPGLGQGRPVWRFWSEPDRRVTFLGAARDNALFLVKWLTLAYVVEALMVRYVPAETIAGLVGGEGPGPVILAASLGAPAYLNGYAAPAIASGLIEQGMTTGAAMAFLIAGGVTCIPAAIAVWALVRPRVFALYFALGFIGAVTAGLTWSAVT